MNDKNPEEQLSFCFDLKLNEVNDLKEEAVSSEEILHMDDALTYNIEMSEFDKCLGIYIELLGDDAESKVL